MTAGRASTRTSCGARSRTALAGAARRHAAVARGASDADPAADLRRPGRRDAYEFLAARNINAPAGSFYALEASRWLGLGDTGGLRVGLAPYNDDDDVDRLLDGLDQQFVRGAA